MPRMDGLTFLRKIMQQHPLPVVICSSLVGKGSETLSKAIEYGATEIIAKPQSGTQLFLQESRITIIDAVKAASLVKPKKLVAARLVPSKKQNADVMLAKPLGSAMSETTERIVVVGASTGGTEALTRFLQALPNNCPGVVIVQHMPEGFTRSFAERLDGLCAVSVKEARNGDSILRGHVLIAPGNHHLMCKRSGARYFVEIKQGPLVSRHRPSVDVLFRSAAKYAGKNVLGIILTGMGDDGAKGMKEMHDAGALTIAQDEATSVVFGMPNEAIKAGGVDKILPLDQIAGQLIR
ncbi:protein-glutamate methylesterase/protein-glutamine glutaminase [Oceanicoccus sagamiensis]|uniref:protein-glutamate methylesterase/protein-glutamine glutaminase n=1 Tax=Oceanicoccus sagamiensis TaxID=716816 RepID=UPI001F0B052E|nr:chemotaxis response regulator protein-glutamate methylesterase [Oceanicoccus sagamiensis]